MDQLTQPDPNYVIIALQGELERVNANRYFLLAALSQQRDEAVAEINRLLAEISLLKGQPSVTEEP